jgi:beta-galactosidase
MQEAGVNLVSLGIFSWSRLQPTGRDFAFGWLDRVMELLHRGGIKVDLATATASPPPWLSHRHPEMLPVLADGTRLSHGSRQHYCPSSPAYRQAAAKLVTALAERYADHPALAMWHCGNEYGCHVPACWCDESAHGFRGWLKARYGSVEELNRAWGTDFWSQRYSDWEEVLPPRRTPTWPNPSQQLDFQRFSSDALLECFEGEVEILRRASPGVPITTNFMGFFKPLDYWKWSAREDVVSNDSYPDPDDPDSGMLAAMTGDLMRSLAGGGPWVLMEQTPYRVNWRPINVAKAPGQQRLWSWQAVARGADGVMFFQWRQSRAGAEKFHSAVVPHGPRDSSPAWLEAVKLGQELRRLDAISGTRVQAEVAILHDWESWWALELPSKPSIQVTWMTQLESYYRPLFEANVTADFASPAADLGRYRLVLAPNLYLVSDEVARNLDAFVAGGGTLVMSFFSGIVDTNDHIRLGGHPAPFRHLLGVRVDDWLPLGEGRRIGVDIGGRSAAGSIWSELVATEGAQVLATFAEGPLAGRPALTKNRHGSGAAYYLATRLDQPEMARLLRQAWTEAGVRPVFEAPAGVEATRRQGEDGSFLFLLNHSSEPAQVAGAAGPELISGRAVRDGLELAGREIGLIVASDRRVSV